MFYWNPTTDYRYAFKKGMKGTDVAAFQINLANVDVDGIFGPQTNQAVCDFQERNNLVVDGVAGPATMTRLVRKRLVRAKQDFALPVGFLDSLAVNESGFNVAAVSKHPSDGGLDIGALQLSTGSSLGSQDFYRNAYTVTFAAEVTGKKSRAFHDSVPSPVKSKYVDDLAGTNLDKFKWQMTILNHNWPSAASGIPKTGFVYNEEKDDQPMQWIIDASNGRLSTPRQWVMNYIDRKSVV